MTISQDHRFVTCDKEAFCQQSVECASPHLRRRKCMLNLTLGLLISLAMWTCSCANRSNTDGKGSNHPGSASLVSQGAEDLDNVGLSLKRVQALREAGDYQQATSQLRKTCKLYPTNEEVHMTLAKVLMENNVPDEARTLLTDSARRWPNSPTPQLLLGYLFYDLRELSQALESFQKALSLTGEPQLRIPAHLGLGAALEKMGRASEADEQYALAVDMAPELQQVIMKVQAERLYPEGIPVKGGVSDRKRLRRLESIIEREDE